ncbi:hypothetical protein [Hymenobacter cellulosilyticus]|nr:hypothetical protein [Hymenobacter cellulosilyticus]
MYFLPVWYLTTEDSLRALRHAKLFWLRTFPYFLKSKKAWSY